MAHKVYKLEKKLRIFSYFSNTYIVKYQVIENLIHNQIGYLTMVKMLQYVRKLKKDLFLVYAKIKKNFFFIKVTVIFQVLANYLK